MRKPTWNTPSNNINLSQDQVHIWRAWLTQPMPLIQQIAELLSDDEKARARRFHFERDRLKFIVGRGILRQILSRYLAVQAEEIQFSYGSQGKPALAIPATQNIQFNLAHSRNLALYAVTCKQKAGIDVEYIRRLDDMAQMAARFFSPRENAAFQRLPEKDKPAGFFNCWTRKEAWLKACGDGLTRPLDQFDVTLTPGDPARILSIRNAPAEAARWQLQAFQPAPNYVAALAVEDAALQTDYWHFSSLLPA
ncbi:MAG TPA: 4'-phosphopantetheinyl transferase superfamily protein [Chloroflexi bacterium]|nr:4'-phosphopantetheinyl transferase superfamily protein [Chloroflexota bacterium]